MKTLPLLLLSLLALGGRSYGFVSYVTANAYSPSVYASSFRSSASAIHRRPAAPTAYAKDSSLIRAARLADRHSHSHSQRRCWKYVKDALLEAGAVRSRPVTSYAYEAGKELTGRYGFVDTGIRNPYRAPVGAVIVYAGHGAGHVELRTERGFASDYRSFYRCKYTRVLGIYVKA